MANKKLPSAETGPSDAILPMHERFMDEIVAGGKNYEFRHYRIKRSVKRIWLYCTAPSSSIKYICEIDPARTRNPGDPPLEEDGRGNREFKNRAKGWEKDDYAYKVRFIYQVQPPVTLADMETKYGMKAAPPSVVSVPESMRSVVVWDLQKKSMGRSPERHVRPAKDFNKQKRPGGEHDAADDMTEGDSKNLLSYFRTSDVKIDD